MPTSALSATPAAPAGDRWRLPVWAPALFAPPAWLAGFAPWLLEGAGRAAPIVLPLRAGQLTALVLGAVVGGLLAGSLARLVPAARRGTALLATGCGTAVAIAVTVGQSVAASGAGSGFDADPRVLAGLAALTAVLGVLGWGVGSLVVAGPVGVGVARGVLAGVVVPWLSLLAPQALWSAPLGTALVWLQALVLAAALVVVGVRPRGRLAAWPVVVLLAWTTGPALTAVGWLEPLLRPGTGLPATLGDALSGAWQVFGLASSPAARDWWPWTAAVVGAVFLAVLRDGRRH
ncbi:hypothetical protein SAMN05660690_3328 [Geodermatophilus telluris]|uniref:Uncharacterized protein n=1 Tax=Geodermatophilus telluris TaxID=1190417 RepID=A0A1G6RWQ0_9ACTN|nr:hypothetical protein [Geodermatophilus telluris]SDD08375.1 hypothetical protein SAMN05660690_3328 [Geodermatophilus telluris]